MDVLLGRLVRAALRRGVGGSPAWLLLAGAAFVLRRARRKEQRDVATVRLAVGERLEVALRSPAAGAAAD